MNNYFLLLFAPGVSIVAFFSKLDMYYIYSKRVTF